jgi:hypothetical protein
MGNGTEDRIEVKGKIRKGFVHFDMPTSNHAYDISQSYITYTVPENVRVRSQLEEFLERNGVLDRVYKRR